MHEIGYVLSRQAQRDLEEIAEHVSSEGGADSAVHVIDALHAAFRLLAGHPHAGHSREDLADPGVRFRSVFSYLVAYAPAQRPLGIACIVHGSRDPQALRVNLRCWRRGEP